MTNKQEVMQTSSHFSPVATQTDNSSHTRSIAEELSTAVESQLHCNDTVNKHCIPNDCERLEVHHPHWESFRR